MLQNGYFLAKIGTDTAENEQHIAEILMHPAAGPASTGWRRSPSSPTTSARRRTRAESRTTTPGGAQRRRVSKISKLNGKFCNFVANFWRARARLYQNEFLQENMRLTTFFKLYKIYILLHRCNLKIFAKNRFEKPAIFVKIQQKFCKCRKICKILPNFKNFSLGIW